jgi:nickel-dependent lactate racemase
MRLNLDYGTTGLTVEFPHEGTQVIEPVDVPPAPDPAAELRRAIRNPMGTAPLRTLVRRGQTVGISVCDITRAQPRRLMLEALLEDMPEARPEDITVFIATGTHRANTPAEIEGMLGPEIASSCRILCHSARDQEALLPMGQTSTGVPILLNREWTAMDVRITTGFVEPHFFAGFSGGPKMVAPGLAGLETVMHLHDAARIGHPRATWGVVEGNPVHDDVREISRLTGVDFSLDVTLNRRQQITQAFAGELLAEHRQACEIARKNAMRPVSRPVDVVITTNSGYPLDQNLYQAVKGMAAAARVVREGGTILAAAECRDGIPDHGAYMEILRSRSSPRELLDMITSEGYSRPDQWQVQIQAQIQLKARVLLKAGGLTDQQVREAHLEPIHDIESVVADLVGGSGDRTLCVLPQGPQTIPYVE